MLGQLPGADQAIEAAARSGYEAVLMVLVVIAAVVLLGWFVRFTIMQQAKRDAEERKVSADREAGLVNRVTVLEEKLSDKLVAVIETTTGIISDNTQSNRDLREATNQWVLAADSWRRHLSTVEQNSAAILEKWDKWKQECDAGCTQRFCEFVQGQLPEALRKMAPELLEKHLPAVLERMRQSGKENKQ